MEESVGEHSETIQLNEETGIARVDSHGSVRMDSPVFSSEFMIGVIPLEITKQSKRGDLTLNMNGIYCCIKNFKFGPHVRGFVPGEAFAYFKSGWPFKDENSATVRMCLDMENKELSFYNERNRICGLGESHGFKIETFRLMAILKRHNDIVQITNFSVK